VDCRQQEPDLTQGTQRTEPACLAQPRVSCRTAGLQARSYHCINDEDAGLEARGPARVETAMDARPSRIICRNAVGRRRESLQAPRTSSRMHTRSANRLSHRATTRPRRSAQRVDQGLFALRRGPEKAGHVGKDTTACIAVGNASIAVTGVHKRSRLIDQARRAAARHTADVIPHHLLTKGRRS
jgi:hypothetical protein